MCACILSHFSSVQLFAMVWTVACQGPLSMKFSRQEYWSGLSCPPPGIFSTKGWNPHLLYLQHCSQTFTAEPLGEPEAIRIHT